ncbi:UNVERIFIED_CONTAM: hypothetical protein FKN15_073172 [Acipenser sinensis]
MDRGSDGKLREVGQVYVYLRDSPVSFTKKTQKLTGTEIYARFGSCVAPLGDLDLDGFNDIAIAAPYGGTDNQGIVYIYNGRASGLNPTHSQVLEGRWASTSMPPSFGYSMHGATDIDLNGYPDLIVGVFGADKAVLYRARPVIGVNATLDVTPPILNPDEKQCTLPGSSVTVSWRHISILCISLFKHLVARYLEADFDQWDALVEGKGDDDVIPNAPSCLSSL